MWIESATRPTKSLVPYARNSRTHTSEQIEQLRASYRQFGFTVPIVIDEDGTIIAGHARVLMAELEKLDEVPVRVAHGWTQLQKAAYVIADNQLALNADWDKAVLALELGELGAAGFDLSLVGFSEAELEALAKINVGPDAFQAFGENVPTDYCCPRCNYRWSGSPDGSGGAEPEQADEAPEPPPPEDRPRRPRRAAARGDG